MREMRDSGVEWMGKVPENWNIVALKFLCSMQSGKTLSSEQISEEGKYPVYGGNGLRGYYSEANTFGDYLLVGRQGALCGNVHHVQGEFWATEHAVVTKCSALSDVRYMYYLLLGMNLNQYASNTAAQPGLAVSQIINVKTCLAPIQEQKLIAVVLDEKCSQVDALIANVQAQIEKLKAYKQSLITEVVTKGLDPTVPMKDSGFEWIGEIPAHWGVTRIKNMFELWNERNDEADLTKVNLISLYTDLGVVQHSDLTATTGNRAVTAEGYKIVRKHDIVVNIILCWMGAVGMSQYDGVTSPAYDIYRPLKDTNSEYYHYLFRTNRFNGECYRYGRGIMMMRWRTYSTEFRAINIPCPPAEEQKKIVTHLNEKCNKIDQLIAIKQAKIEKLEQYKRSLIYEYVTGKKEVR